MKRTSKKLVAATQRAKSPRSNARGRRQEPVTVLPFVPPSHGFAVMKAFRSEGSGSAMPTPVFSLVRITKKGGSLSKKISQNSAGELAIDSSACSMMRGEAWTVAINDGMRGLAKLYADLGQNEAVVFSNADLGSEPREVCTEAAYNDEKKRNPNIICRSRRFLGAVSAPGLQLFEVDDHGLPQGKVVPNATEMVKLLDEVLPELDIPGAAKLRTHSTSSFIYESATDRELKGEGGKHIAMLLSDLSRAAALKNLLEVRQWANGYGHIYISRDGKQLERTVLDLSVFAPERLVFEAGAALSAGLMQRRPPPSATEGHALDMARLPSPTLAERERAATAKRLALEATRTAAAQARATYIQAESKKLASIRGITESDAERIVTQRAEASSVCDGDALTFTDRGSPDTETVGHVLDHIEEFVGRAMCDPIDPEDGPSKAMILRGPGGQPYIRSYAHGGRRYTFDRLVGQEGAADRALFKFTDLANAHRLAKAFGDDLIAAQSGWLVFTGRHWERSDQLVEARALNLSRLVLQDAEYLALLDRIKQNDFAKPEEADEARKSQKAWTKFATKCEDKGKIAPALNVARTLLWQDVSKLNSDPWLFNVRNGTIDLRTGVLRPHDRHDLITSLAPVEYDPAAKCPVFEKTALEVFAGDAELVAFLRRFLGYCLTGVTIEQKFLIAWGDGSNGKGTILGTVQKVLGRDYCGAAPPKLLEGSKSDRHPTEIADLFGKRVVLASETEEGALLREAFLKLATGGDTLKARFMHKDFVEFDPTHKFILQTNHKPEVKGTDYAIWRRPLLLPFEVIFGDAKDIAAGDATQLKDKTLSDRLTAELDGVLVWMVHGCLEWQEKGLAEPEAVRGATATYREEQDRIGQFVAERCEFGAEHFVEQAFLYQRYRNWAFENGYNALGSGKVRKQLLKMSRGKVTAGRTTSGKNKNIATYVGIALTG